MNMKKIDVDSWHAIQMDEFLLEFANLDGLLTEEIVNELALKRATHIDITELGIDYIVRVPNDIIDASDLLTGRIILVEDFLSTPRKRRVAPYRRPSLVKEDLERKQREKEQLENEGAKNYGKFYWKWKLKQA